MSRFVQQGEKKDYFLHYMLSKVFNINLLNLKHGEEKGTLFDFLIFLFPFFLRRALKKGLFRAYITYECNDSSIKGQVNVPRYFKNDIPFMGKIAYDKREYSTDNYMTELVRHTIEFIRSGSYSSIILDKDVSANVKKIVEVTHSYDRARREFVINRNLRPVRHPYYSEWTDLQRICLMILRHNKLNYAESKDKIYGVVFDVSWLWEEYLNTLLHPMGFVHPRNKENTDAIYLFRGDEDTNEDKLSGDRYPDFYNDYCVLDAKYKRLENKGSVSSIDREDLHQMITYMYIINSHPQNGVFLFPVENTNSLIHGLKLNGYGGTIRAVGHVIPQDAISYKDFCERMETKASDFTECIKKLNSKNFVRG
jgi:5-methylcytosine-specific restriction endonuclease McrBC regulatory subunit McrC